jgi:prephenate dehydrogenase
MHLFYHQSPAEYRPSAERANAEKAVHNIVSSGYNLMCRMSSISDNMYNQVCFQKQNAGKTLYIRFDACRQQKGRSNQE